MPRISKNNSFQYMIKVPALQKKPISKIIAKKAKKIEAMYHKTVGIEVPFGENVADEVVLKIGKIIDRPRSIIIEVPFGIRLNVLSDALRAHLDGTGAQVPYWS